MAANSINDVSYDEATSVDAVKEVVQGQPQTAQRGPDDGKVSVQETFVQSDTVILDPNHDLAVQIPEGVGATSTDRPNPIAEAHARGTAEQQFAAEAKADSPAPKAEKPKA